RPGPCPENLKAAAASSASGPNSGKASSSSGSAESHQDRTAAQRDGASCPKTDPNAAQDSGRRSCCSAGRITGGRRSRDFRLFAPTGKLKVTQARNTHDPITLDL